MPTTVKLDRKPEALLKETARITHYSKTEIIKRSIRQYCPQILDKKRRHPYELIEDILEKMGSGRGDLSIRGEEILRKAFRGDYT